MELEMTELESDARAFGKQIAVEAILKTLLAIELSRLPTEAERYEKRLEIRRTAEKLAADALIEEVDPDSATHDVAEPAVAQVVDAVFGVASKRVGS